MTHNSAEEQVLKDVDRGLLCDAKEAYLRKLKGVVTLE